MTKDVSKMKYKEAQAIYEDSSEPKELRSQAKERMDSIRDWLKSKEGTSDFKPKKSTFDRRALEPKDFEGLDEGKADACKIDTENLLGLQLCRIYYIEKGLADRGIAGNGPFVGMLYNNQVATN